MQPKDDSKLAPHHAAWLNYHPNRDESWLRERFKDGFDVHHIDGDHSNNDPNNLVLIEHLDHMRLHGAVMSEGRLRVVSRKGKKRPRRSVTLPDGRVVPLQYREKASHVLLYYGRDPTSKEWDIRTGVKKSEIGQEPEKPKSRKDIFSEPYDRGNAYLDMWKAASKA